MDPVIFQLKVLTNGTSKFSQRNYSISHQSSVNNNLCKRINPTIFASTFAIRHQSTVNLPGEGEKVLDAIPIQSFSNDPEKLLEVIPIIPEPPQPLPDVPALEAVDVVQSLNSAGEPTFASLGLGGWTPVGLVQNALEYLHITLDIPW